MAIGLLHRDGLCRAETDASAASITQITIQLGLCHFPKLQAEPNRLLRAALTTHPTFHLPMCQTLGRNTCAISPCLTLQLQSPALARRDTLFAKIAFGLAEVGLRKAPVTFAEQSGWTGHNTFTTPRTVFRKTGSGPWRLQGSGGLRLSAK